MPKKNLMIVESPAKAKTIEKYLGEDFVVKASFGHVRDLPKGDDAIDYDQGFTPKYEVLSDKKEVIRELKKLAKEVETVWLATDEDREGEAISWHLAEVLGLDIPTARRVVFNEITKKAVTNAVANPRVINQDLVNAQQARRVLDRIVGFNLSPVLWKKVRTGLSAGRVQSVAVRLIVERERDIIDFTATSSFRITAEFRLEGGVKLKAQLKNRIPTIEEARAFLQECVGADFNITNLETRPGKKTPAAPFTTSTLQQEASRKLSFSVAQTMRVAQGLYEAGFITYMRTDSVSLSGFAIDQAKQVVTDLYGAEYHKVRQFKSKSDSAQEAHEAIRPTDMNRQEAPGDRNAKRLYELIWKRTVASQMADAILEKTTATIGISSSERNLVATGEVLKFEGFLKVYLEGRDEEDGDDDNSGVLPPLTIGQKLQLDFLQARERFSKHPPRYTEASLVKKLEEQGIGRPSTYAPTISTIQKRNYVSKETREGNERHYNVVKLAGDEVSERKDTEITGAEKNKLFPTDLGMLVTDFLIDHFPGVLDYRFTAKVEEEFDEIASGKKIWNNMIGNFYGDFAETVEITKEEADRVSKERYLGEHPKNGEPIYAKFGKYGPFVQLGETSEEVKPKYSSLRSDQRLDTITLEDAIDLFRLPRILGNMDEQDIKVNVGRYGPYVQLGKLFVSIPKEEDPYNLGLERAIELIEAKKEADRNKIIQDFGEEGQVLNGRWGPYIKMQGKNIKIPKDMKAEELTLEDCKKLYEEQKDKPKRGRGRKKK
ncbi:MAG: type I DNA topoisomerase [Bacteroidota bacterium]